MPSELAHINDSAWEQLAAAADYPEASFRYVSLCSVDAASRPQARMVVLRRADVAQRLLEIHTDVRSAKWHELSANPQATAPPAATHEADGKAHFGVVTFRTEVLDWFQLRRQNNRRACFAYGANGRLASSQWVNP
ncbi:pyridoxamine 5'-phosphate oxidase family protein [Halomonas sp. NyZ770]|uniref:pyridoxamine 5'-phosphate oxidase family protein n=1 Tax=Halomonas sp. NyZ770 TaxID=2883106 RepID=UPI001D0AB21B|nr:pyridoxamine 5'-phosphate oxidase family protein [Halomonas sp. NyZ770]UDM06189.1 pyridoxamine 5'-phosphate oxidase family protein [Halomonas sp. NyZ770]WGL63603.1 pyridoxamine 5'-phosphate oxidase family protein [Pseudomonas sp. CW003PS]